MQWYLRACPVCGGDMHEDASDRAWATCMLCARSFKVREIALPYANSRTAVSDSDA
jgi:hypothetical protein